MAFDGEWAVRKVPLGATPHHLVYERASGL
jgi:hypothetical protein